MRGNDFHELHQVNPVHLGILTVYQDSDAAKNMSYQAIVKAMFTTGYAYANLETAEYPLENQFVILN